MDDLLFEIGSDEIPARYMPQAINDLQERSAVSLRAARFGFDNVSVFGTPRRLVLYVTGLTEVSQEAEFRVRGPSFRAAYDKEGKPTKALLGFSRSLGISPGDVVIEKSNAGEYVYGLRKESGRTVDDALPEILPALVFGMECPHPLRWGEQNWRWYRAIRWIVCLYGSKVVPVELAGRLAGRNSFGHRTLHPEPVSIPAAGDYFSLMEEAGVIVDQEQRRASIAEGASACAASMGGAFLQDHDLLEEIIFLAEHPVPFLGTFDTEYLNLPREVLVTVMRYHQRYFTVVSKSGEILPGFVGVRDGHSSHGMDTVRRGNEWVIRARLSDAEFFYRQDLKVKLEDRLTDLKGVGFLKGAGSMYDKTARIFETGQDYAARIGLSPADRETVAESSRLAKCDLVTHMVGEFAELEGIMGGHYAARQGLPEPVCGAIGKHYLPRSTKDPLPDKGPGSVLALADKMDTLAIAFSLGIEVSGSQDPLGLRRAAQGVVSILIGHKYEISLDELAAKPLELAGARLKSSLPSARERLRQFLLGRVEVALTGQSYPIEIVRAVLSGGEKRIARLGSMVHALACLAGTEKLAWVVTGWRRTSVLAKASQSRSVREDLLSEEPEIALYRTFQAKKESAGRMLEGGRYADYLDVLAGLRPDIDLCLDKVLIMARDPEIRDNRLALLGEVSDLFTAFADFSHTLPLVP